MDQDATRAKGRGAWDSKEVGTQQGQGEGEQEKGLPKTPYRSILVKHCALGTLQSFHEVTRSPDMFWGMSLAEVGKEAEFGTETVDGR